MIAPDRHPNNSGELDRIEIYVSKHFPDMNSSEKNIYFNGLRRLERRSQLGRNAAMLVSEEEWRRYTGLCRQVVRDALPLLRSRGVIEYTSGHAGSYEKKRTKGRVRRRSIEEIRNNVDPRILNRFVPVEAETLAERLRKHPVPWNDDHFHTNWIVTVSGRVQYSGKSPLTSKGTSTKAARRKALRRALKPDEVLVEADWTAADPTVLLHGMIQAGLLSEEYGDGDFYCRLIDPPSVPNRKEAKEFYHSKLKPYTQRRVIAAPWELRSGDFLQLFLENLNKYRDHMWEMGKPTPNSPRHIYTLCGRKIETVRGAKTHRGQMLAWHAQGTVADVFTKVVTEILDDDAQGLCRLMLPVHDAVFVAIPANSPYDPSIIMDKHARSAGLPLVVNKKGIQFTASW